MAIASNGWSAAVSAGGSDISIGMAVTLDATGNGMVPATAANLGTSKSGVIEGIAVTPGSSRQQIIIFQAGRLSPSQVPNVGTGVVEFAVVDATGAIVRSPTYTASAIGITGEDGSVTIMLALFGGLIASGGGGSAIGIGVAATSGVAGDVMVTSGHASDPTRITKATTSALTVGVLPVGVALLDYSAGLPMLYAPVGATVPASVIGLGVGDACYGVVNSSGRVIRKSAPDGGDVVIGEVNTRGNLVVLPFRPFTSDVVLGQGPFFAVNDGTADVSAALRLAVAAANISDISLNFSGKRVRIPKGQWLLEKPVHVKYAGMAVCGDYIYASHLRTLAMAGPSLYCAPGNVGEFPHQSGQYGVAPNDNALIVKAEVAVQDEHWLDLREYGAGFDLAGLAAFTIEMVIKIDSTTSANTSPVVAGYGELATGDPVAQVMGVQYGAASGSPNANAFIFSLRTTAGTSVLSTPVNTLLPSNGQYHVLEFSWDGSTIRGFLDGVQQTLTVAFGSTSLGGTMVQQDWEWVSLGGMFRDWGGYRLVSTADFHLASLRLSTVARHTSGYSPPANTKFTEDSSTLFLLNGDRYDDIFVIARSRGTKGNPTLTDTYIPHRHDNVGLHVAPNISVTDLSISSHNGGTPIDMNSVPNARVERVNLLGRQGIRMFNNCYKGTIDTAYVSGQGGRCAILLAGAANSMAVKNIYPSSFAVDIVLSGAGDVILYGTTYCTAANLQLICENSFNINIQGNPTFSDESTTITGHVLRTLMFFRNTDIVNITGAQFSQLDSTVPLIIVQTDGLFGDLSLTLKSCYMGAAPSSNGMIDVKTPTPAGHIHLEDSPIPGFAAAVNLLTSGSASSSRLILTPQSQTDIASVALPDSNTTLSRNTYLKNYVVNFTGALTANRTVTIPAGRVGERVWRNNTTGGFSVLLVVSGGANTVTIAAGAKARTLSSGTDVEAL